MEEEKKQNGREGEGGSEEKGKMEGGSVEKAGPQGSPAGLNNARQNAVGHPLLRFLKPREIEGLARGGRPCSEGESGQDFSLSAQR